MLARGASLAARPIFRQLPQQYRRMATQATAQALVYDAPGDPLQVLELRQLELGPCSPSDIKVRMLAAPINPSDVNTVEGKYPLQPAYPGAVPGHEGVGEVLEVGAEVTGLKVGDRVVPLEPAQGTWREAGIFKASHWHAVPRDLPLNAAATLCINPPSALGMLESFVDLKPGDVVIQNGGNSAVGQAVIQIAKARGFKTVNIIRPRENWDETVAQMTALGADVVTTEQKLKADYSAAGLPEAALALNCVGGSAATSVAKMLRKGGVMVTYGAMSMQPINLPTALLIFKDITCKGFWLSGSWGEKMGLEGKARLMDSLSELILQGNLNTAECELVPAKDWRTAMERYRAGFVGKKMLLQF